MSNQEVDCLKRSHPCLYIPGSKQDMAIYAPSHLPFISSFRECQSWAILLFEEIWDQLDNFMTHSDTPLLETQLV